MTTNIQYDYETFAERLSQVNGKRLSEEEFKRDFPEITYQTEFGGNKIVSIDNFIIGERVAHMVARSEKAVTILKVAQFGPPPTESEQQEAILKDISKIEATLSALESDPDSLDPETEVPFVSEEMRAEYITALKAAIPILQAKLNK